MGTQALSNLPVAADGSDKVPAALYGQRVVAGDQALVATSSGALRVVQENGGGLLLSYPGGTGADNDPGRQGLTIYPRPSLYNPAGDAWDRWRGNHKMTLLASAARTGDTNSADQVNYNHRGVVLLIDVTAVGAPAGALNQIVFQVKAGASYKLVGVFSGAPIINAVGQKTVQVFPGATQGGYDYYSGFVLPRDWRLQVVHANQADSITYSVTAYYVV
ncbi:MAG: hypothetical protein HY690_18545 [Chloroflexi bacterium]|nr:hypothetical protein [Chloroflexota bacterium]